MIRCYRDIAVGLDFIKKSYTKISGITLYLDPFFLRKHRLLVYNHNILFDDFIMVTGSNNIFINDLKNLFGNLKNMLGSIFFSLDNLLDEHLIPYNFKMIDYSPLILYDKSNSTAISTKATDEPNSITISNDYAKLSYNYVNTLDTNSLYARLSNLTNNGQNIYSYNNRNDSSYTFNKILPYNLNHNYIKGVYSNIGLNRSVSTYFLFEQRNPDYNFFIHPSSYFLNGINFWFWLKFNFDKVDYTTTHGLYTSLKNNINSILNVYNEFSQIKDTTKLLMRFNSFL